MGVVYAAHDERLERPVALKMIREASTDDKARERLWREARAAASVSHPNICQLFEIAEEDGELFIAMELLEGESLAERLGRGPLKVAEAAQTALAMLAALEALHRRELVHRDLKPSNVFLTPHGIKLLDFGLARPFQQEAGDASLTQTGVLIGTPRYLAPEQILGRPVDERGDLFAAGAILFEMLSGRPAFDGTAVMEVLSAVLHEQPAVLGGSAAIAALDRVIHRALAKQPERRYASAAAMADDLRRTMALGDTAETPRAHPITRLMVLPLRILRSDPETDFLAYSLPDAVTSSLSGLDSLIVRSSLTAAAFASGAQDLESLAGKADVDAVLTGTLLRAGDQLRVNTQLAEVPGGAVLWSQTSQVPLGDVFKLQDELTRRIVESLALPLSARDRGVLGRDVPATAKAYECYLRANQLGTEARHWTVARDLYLQCLAEDPGYAPAWARLGRIHRVIGTYLDADGRESKAKAEEAFKRALELNPELSVAHNLYTYLEVEMGRAQPAMLRLLERAKRRTADAELFAGLVQACRYAGLLEASVAAYETAVRVEPGIRTSVAHSYFMLGQYQRAIETEVADPPEVAGLALVMLGREAEALERLRSTEQSLLPRSGALHDALIARRTLLEGKRSECLIATHRLLEKSTLRDPCGLFYMGRHLVYLGDLDRGLELLLASIEGGFCCHSFATRDPWLDPIRARPEFRDYLSRSAARYGEAVKAFLEAGGDRVLGVSPAVTA